MNTKLVRQGRERELEAEVDTLRRTVEAYKDKLATLERQYDALHARVSGLRALLGETGAKLVAASQSGTATNP